MKDQSPRSERPAVNALTPATHPALPLEHAQEYDAVAEYCARRGLTGAIGDSLPLNMNANGALLWINADPEAFQERVRQFAYGIAMEGL